MADDVVDRVEVAAYTVPTDAPEGDGTFAWSSTTMVLAEVSGGGVTGIGWTYAAAACVPLVRDVLAPVACGRRVVDVPGVWEAMVRACRNLGRPGLVSCAIAAVDIALWDLKARLLGLPLCRLLGAVRDAVPVYGSGGFTTYDDEHTRAQLGHWAHEQGIPRVKIKIGESWGRCEDRDLARVRLARAVIGDGTELYVDANGGYSRKQAVRLARGFAESDVRWFEEPVSSDDLAGLGVVRDAVDADVAAGEYGFDLVYFARMAPVVDCLQADASRCAGITEWLRVAALAAASGLSVSAHCCPHLHAHPAAAVPNLRHVEWFHDHVRLEGMLFEGTLDPSGGVVRPDQGRPGLGLEFRRADAEQYRVA